MSRLYPQVVASVVAFAVAILPSLHAQVEGEPARTDLFAVEPVLETAVTETMDREIEGIDALVNDVQAQPVADDAPTLIAEPVAEPTVDPFFIDPVFVDPVVEPVVAPAVEPAVEPVIEPVFPLDAPVVAPTAPAPAPAPWDAPAPASAPWDAPAPVAQVESAAPAGSVAVVMGQEEIKRRAYKNHLRETLASAQAAMLASRFDMAIDFYEEAYGLVIGIGDRPEDRPERETALAGLAEAEYRHGLFMRGQGDLDKALALARKSAGRGHPEAPKLAGEVLKEIEKPKPVKVETPRPRWREAEYKSGVAETDDLMRRGREHFVSGELSEAKVLFETVLSRDSENTEAIRMLQKIGHTRYDSASIEFAATKAAMIASVRDTWNPRDYQFSAAETIIKPPPTTQEASASLKIKKKMEAIKIAEIDFRQANIHDVINFLQQASIENDDQSKADEERGVNIILNLALSGAAALPAPTGFALAAGGPAPGAEDVPLITFSARYISLYEALKIVTEVASLKFRISGTVVMVLRKDAPEGEILHRMYDVLPSVGDKIEQVAPALARGATAGRSDFTGMGGTGVGVGRGDWKDFFAEMGVSWPQGSSVKYVPTIGKIVVANTAENLTIFESVLGVLNVVPFQIEIESRFVEVAQKDLESLGFEWNLTDDWEIAQKKSSAGSPFGSMQRISMGATSLTGGMRFANVEGTLGTGVTVNDSVMSVASVLTNPELQFVLHALQQRGSTDLLSAPKVTTQSGLEATLKVVTEYIYPTSFTVSGIQGQSVAGQNLGNVGAVVEPSNFETREVGVILSVLAEVSPEGQMINLTMSPEVVSEPEWFNYGSTYTDPDGNVQQLNMPQPFFHSRSIQTSISVYNGATVVMGGLISENRTTVDDKIPFLGDIPLVGRLFRSRVDNSQKRNLLIFVTARLVDPAGRAVRRSETQLPVMGGDEGVSTML